MSEVRGGAQEELPHVRGQGQQPRGATPRPRSGAMAEKSNPTSEVRDGCWEEQLHVQGARAQEGREDLLHIQGQEGRLVLGREQWLCLAEAAVKSYPTSRVRETQVRR